MFVRRMIYSRHHKAPWFRLILWIVLLAVVLWIYSNWDKAAGIILNLSNK